MHTSTIFRLLLFVSYSFLLPMKNDGKLSIALLKNDNDFVITQNGNPLFFIKMSLGADEYFLNPGRGLPLCSRHDGMELALSLPLIKNDDDRLIAGIIAHNKMMGIGDYVPKKLFFFAVSARSSKTQLCGAICVQVMKDFYIIKIGNPTDDKQSLQVLMDYIDMEAYNRNLKRIMIQISNENCFFNDMCGLGFNIKGVVPDFHGGYDVLLGKDVQEHFLLQNSCADIHDKYEIMQRDVGFDVGLDGTQYQYEKKTFFTIPIESCENDIDSASLDVGLFVYDVDGKNYGGCSVKIFNEDKIPHLYIDSVWLDPKVRGEGIAKKIIYYIEQWAKKKFGCMYSHLTTAEYQAPWLYEKCGYTAAITFPEYVQAHDGKVYSSYIFIKKL